MILRSHRFKVLPIAPVFGLALSMIITFSSIGFGQHESFTDVLTEFADQNFEKRTTVTIQGLQSMSEAEAKMLLGDRLRFILGRSPSPSRADDAAFLLKRILHREGFADASVTWSIPKSQNEIILTVDEGLRQMIGKVTFKGLETFQQVYLDSKTTPLSSPPTDSFFTSLFTQPIVSRQPVRTSRIPYLERDIPKGVSNIQTWLAAEGFWDAQAELIEMELDSNTGNIDFTIHVSPGKRYTIQEISITGEPGSLNDEALGLLSSLSGKPASATNIGEARNRVGTLYRQKGYYFAAISMNRSTVDQLMDLEFTIHAGERYRIKNVTFKGNEKTKTRIFNQRFGKHIGQEYNPDDLDKTVKQFLKTGAFTKVRPVETVTDDGFIDVEIEIEEGRAKSFNTYFGADSFEGVVLGMGYNDRNWLGNLWNLDIQTEMTSLGVRGMFRLTNPWIWESEWSLQSELHALQRTYSNYDKLETALMITLSRSYWNEKYLTSYYLGAASVGLSSKVLSPEELGLDSYVVSYLGMSHELDFRNSSVSPTSGWYLRSGLELGSALGGGVGYLKMTNQATIFIPAGDRAHFALGSRMGVIIPMGGERDQTGENIQGEILPVSRLPIDLRFFEGGANSVRGYANREMGPRNAQGEPLGGESYVVFNGEYVRSLSGIVKWVAFLDAGALSATYDQLDFEFRLAAGLGLRLDLPIGPVRFEYGHLINPGPGDPNGAFHFSIGVAF